MPLIISLMSKNAENLVRRLHFCSGKTVYRYIPSQTIQYCVIITVIALQGCTYSDRDDTFVTSENFFTSGYISYTCMSNLQAVSFVREKSWITFQISFGSFLIHSIFQVVLSYNIMVCMFASVLCHGVFVSQSLFQLLTNFSMISYIVYEKVSQSLIIANSGDEIFSSH